MNRDEIKKQIKDLKDEIASEMEEIETTKIYIGDLKMEIEALENKLEKKPPVILWEPKKGDWYYMAHNDNEGVAGNYNWLGDRLDFDRQRFGQVFPTRALAELSINITLATQEYKRRVAIVTGKQIGRAHV